MSLDVYLKRNRKTLYCANITHNLCGMAVQAGIYRALWSPYKLIEGYNIPEEDHIAENEFEEKNKITAKEIIPLLKKGLKDLKTRPDYYKTFEPENGWGTYERFVSFIERYLEACLQYPEATVETSR